MNYLDILQKINNTLYSKTGLNSITLKLQVWINTERSRKNIHDPKEVICIDENQNEYVQ